jgi:hypothetical protein
MRKDAMFSSKEESLSEDERELVERVQSLVLTEPFRWTYHAPPVHESDLVRAEALLGFHLPSLLRQLYLQVGNGGFGPGYGLYPLDNAQDPQALRSDSLLTTSLTLRSMTPEEFVRYWKHDVEKDEMELSAWPEHILEVCDWGCNIYSYLNCSQPGYPVLRLDHNTAVRRFDLEALSFRQWLEAWLDHAYQ